MGCCRSKESHDDDTSPVATESPIRTAASSSVDVRALIRDLPLVAPDKVTIVHHVRGEPVTGGFLQIKEHVVARAPSGRLSPAGTVFNQRHEDWQRRFCVVNAKEVAEGARRAAAHLDAERAARDAEDCGAAEEELKRAILVPKNENYSLKWYSVAEQTPGKRVSIMLSTMLGLGSDEQNDEQPGTQLLGVCKLNGAAIVADEGSSHATIRVTPADGASVFELRADEEQHAQWLCSLTNAVSVANAREEQLARITAVAPAPSPAPA